MQYMITCIILSDKFEPGDCLACQANYMHLSSLGSGVELLKLFTLNKIVELLGF